MESYSAAKRTEVKKFVSKWMELENITPSEVSQTQKERCGMFSRSHSYVDPSIESLDLLVQLADIIREITLCNS